MRSLLFIIFYFLFTQTVYAETSWDKKVEGNVATYAPNTLKPEEYFIISIINNVAMNSRSSRATLQHFISNNINTKWALTRAGEIDTKNKGILMTTARFKTDNFSDMRSMFFAVPTSDSKMNIMQVDYSHNYLLKRFLNKITQLSSNLGSLQVTNSPTKATSITQNHSKIPAFKKLSGIKGIAIISNMGLNVFSRTYQLKSRNILLFENGLFSNDLKTILEKGIAFSQKSNPDEWGKFKISNGKLSLKYNDSDQFDTQEYFTLYLPNPKNKKLFGCWDSSKTFEFSNGVSTSSGMGISGYCFDKNGRFSKNSTFGFSGGIENSPYGKAYQLPVGNYSSASEKSQLGWYRIDKYTIQLHYDDGTTETKFIGIDDMLLLDNNQLFKIEK
ncbi:MAG: hypothetical protein P8179_07660 [Candidatus Thiodiazotropha sp.]